MSSPPNTLISPPHSSAAPTLSLIIIFFLLALVTVTTLSSHLLLRFLSCRLRRRRAATAPSSLPHTNSTSSSSANSIVTSTATSSQNASLINSLPLITLSVLPLRSPVDCAVCLSRFRSDDKLRMLPACRHAFHSACIDRWLRSTPSCPLCRSSIECQPLPPPPTAAPVVVLEEEEAATNIGTWLKDYVDRLASAASSPFSSMRWGSSRRFSEGEGSTDDAGSVRLEVNWEGSFRSSESRGSDSGYFASSYKWGMAGAVP